jgi:hypothetical protein
MLYRVQQGLAVYGEFPALSARQPRNLGIAGHSARRQLSGAAAEADACVVDSYRDLVSSASASQGHKRFDGGARDQNSQ